MVSANGNRQADDNLRPEQLNRVIQAVLACFNEFCRSPGYTYSEVSYALFERGAPPWVIAVNEIFLKELNPSVIQPFVTTTTQDHVDENGYIVTTTRRVLNISY
jgi:hypothetical protein